MNTKWIGFLNNIMFAPETLVSGSGASVESSPGSPTKGAPETDNIYGGESETTEVAKEPTKEEKTEEVQETETPEGQKVEGVEKKVEKKEDKPALLRLDPESIAELKKGLAPQAPIQKEEPAKLTPEQLKQVLNPVEVSPKILQELGFENPTNEQVTGFQNFANSVVKNAVSIARVMIQQKEKEFQAILGPIQSSMESASMEQAKSEFFTSNKELADPKFAKVVQAAAREVEPNNADGSPKTKQQIFTEVAKISKEYLTSLGVKFDTANLGAGGEKKEGVQAPNKFSPSGRSGGDTNGQRGKSNDADADIYKR